MKMDYFVLGTNNMPASITFYDAIFEQTDLKQVLSTDRMTFWQGYYFAFAVATPFDEEPNERGPRFSAFVRDLDKNKLCFYE